MFHTIEKYKGPAKVLLGLIALTFVGFGVSTVAAPGSDYIAKVGDQKVSSNDVNAAVQNAQAQGVESTPQSLFQSLLQRAYLTEGVKSNGIAVSLEQVKKAIVDDPMFHDEKGQFSKEKLNAFLVQRQLTEDQFVAELQQEFALQNLMSLAQAGNLVSDVQAQQLLNVMMAKRVVRTITLQPSAFAAGVKVDDVALKAFYTANKKQYVVPEAVQFEFLELAQKELADKQTVSEAELKQAYDKDTASNAAAERREVAHIMFAVSPDADAAAKDLVKAEAEKVLLQLKAKPDNFSALAKQFSKDDISAQKGGSLGVIAQDGSRGKVFEQAAFALAPNGTSDVVETEFGYHIIKAGTAVSKATFEQEKPRLETLLKQQKSAQAFVKAKEQLAELTFNNPTDLKMAAKQMGLEIKEYQGWMGRETVAQAGLPATLTTALFSDEVMNKKQNSDVVEMSPDIVWVVRAKEVRKESADTFEQAKEQVQRDYLNQETVKLAKVKAQKLLSDLKSGEKLALAWSSVEELSAEQARSALPPAAYTQMLKAHPQGDKPAYLWLEGLPAPVIMEIQAVKLPENILAEMPQAKQLLVQNQTNGILSSLIVYLQKQIPYKEGAQKIESEQD